MNALFVFLGGGTGALARYCMGLAISHHTGNSTFPYHTMSINLLGAFLIGALMEVLALRTSLPESVQFLLVTGFLGGFTTFSAFALESSLMLERGDYAACAIYIAVSVIGTIFLVFGGASAIKAIF
jgi:CrcB protein